jgi:hypothetical protein
LATKGLKLLFLVEKISKLSLLALIDPGYLSSSAPLQIRGFIEALAIFFGGRVAAFPRAATRVSPQVVLCLAAGEAQEEAPARWRRHRRRIGNRHPHGGSSGKSKTPYYGARDTALGIEGSAVTGKVEGSDIFWVRACLQQAGTLPLEVFENF